MGIRPYLLLFAAVIPLWSFISVSFEAAAPQTTGGAKRPINGTGNPLGGAVPLPFFLLWTFLLWNGVLLFGASINVLPYLMAGEGTALAAGFWVLGQQLVQHGSPLGWSWGELSGMMKLLFIMHSAFVLFCLPMLFLARGRNQAKAALLDLFMLTAAVPLSIVLLIMTQHFWRNYFQLFAPFVGLGAASLLMLLAHWARASRIKARLRPFWPRYRLIPLALVAALTASLIKLDAVPPPNTRDPDVTVLQALLARHGITADDFLAPRNMYVHWRLNAPRHGFPHAEHTQFILHGWWQNLHPPPLPFPFHLPKTRAEYCRALDLHGPGLIVFFHPSPLLDCSLSRYAYHEALTPTAAGPRAVRYFLKSETP